MSSGEHNDLMFLVSTPVGRDAELTCKVLDGARLSCLPCGSTRELIDRAARGQGPLVLSTEAFHDEDVVALLAMLEVQPSWSDLPVILFTSRRGESRSLLDRLARRRSTTVLRRPIRVQTFLAVARAAAEARRHQLGVRDLLEELRAANESLALRANLLRELTLELSIVEHRERRRVATLLHDHLQQILAASKLRLNRLKRHLDDEDHVAQARQVEELISQAIAASRSLSYELSPPVLHQSGLGAALEWLANMMEREHDLAVEVQVEPGMSEIPEPLRVFLFQAARELLFNVTKHARTDRAEVELSQDGAWFRLGVSDMGRGFDPSKSSLDNGGSGFGLFGIREKIEMLGGSLEVESRPGQGARFVLSAPRKGVSHTPPPVRVARLAAEPSPGPRPPDTNGALRLVVADDHDLMRQGLVSMMRDEPDIEVVGEASTGREALDLVRRLRPDVVVMDVSMPDLDGIEATRTLRAELPEVQVIGLSMFEDPGVADQMLAAGAAVYLSKSGPMERLLATLRTCQSELDRAP